MQPPRIKTVAGLLPAAAWAVAAPLAARAQTPEQTPEVPPPRLPPPELPPPELPTGVPPANPTDPGALFNEAFFLRLGFSFLVGLAVGFALKVAFKIAIVVVGVVLLGVFGLQYAGLVDVNWSGVEVQYDTWAGWLRVQGGAFLDFVGANLSSGASFLAGLALGLKL
jgi:uncharacterized membrane protein (Fun14 family)